MDIPVSSQVRQFGGQISRVELDATVRIEEERLPGYRADRYYPVGIGDVFESRYKVITKLGFGTASTTWLSWDMVENRYVAIKVHVRYAQAPEELKISKHLANFKDATGFQNVRLPISSFQILGPHGTHPCLVYQPSGMNFYDFTRMFEGGVLIEQLLRVGVRSILIALEFLHRAGVIHTDVQPDNILLGIGNDTSALSRLGHDDGDNPLYFKRAADDRIIYASCSMPITDGEPILADLGEARLTQTDQKHKGLIMPSRYRAPEVMFNMGWNSKVDIWALGQTIWTLFEGNHMFQATELEEDIGFEQRCDQMEVCFGRPPPEFLERSPRAKTYWSESEAREVMKQPFDTLEQREHRLQGTDKENFLRLLRKMLEWLPEKRPSAEDLLSDAWIRGDDY